MFKVSSILTDTAIQSLSSLADCSVNDTLVKVVPFLEQSFFQIISVTDPAAVHSLLQNAPERSSRLKEADDQFFLRNSVVTFLAKNAISFFNSDTFDQNLSSCDNIC